jgi:bacterioferritin (cytochrome b1)
MAGGLRRGGIVARNRTTERGASAPIRGYDSWPVDELQEKLARRTTDELESLLGYEKGGRKRKRAIEAIERVLASKGKSSSRPSASKVGGAPLGDMVERVRSGVQSGVKSGVKKVRELVGFPPEPLGPFSREAFMERLSEFLEHERNGAKLYEQGLDKEGMTEDQLEHLREFAEQTNRHIDILSTIIIALGGDPDDLSEPALLNRQKATGLIETDAEGETGILNYFQNLMIAEWVDHMNWEFLAKAKARIDDEEVVQVLDEHIESIEDEEDEHYRWAMKQVENLSMMGVFPSESAEDFEGEAESAEAEEEEADEETVSDDDDEEAA